MLRAAYLLIAAVLLWLAACDDTGPGGTQPGGGQTLLLGIDECEDLEGVIRDRVSERMREIVMANYDAVLESGACSQFTWNAGDGDADADIDGDGDSDVAVDMFSRTSSLDEGVEEADFVETDGEYIYLISGTELLIIDATPAAGADVVTRFPIEGTPSQLYVYEGHAAVFSTTTESDSDVARDDCYWDEYTGAQICGATQLGTLITVLDLTDREAPVVERMMEISGLLMGSRRIESRVHTVMSYPDFGLSTFIYCPNDIYTIDPSNHAALWRAFSDVIEQNEELIDLMPLEDWLPTVTDTLFAADGTATVSSDYVAGCDGFLEASTDDGRSFVSVVSFDLLERDGAIAGTSIIGDQGVFYASRDALYVANRQVDDGSGRWFFDDSEAITQATTVHRFAFDPDGPSATYDGSGVVPGRIPDPHSMSEYQGVLRVATTVGHLPDPDASNNVFVLEPRDGGLEIVGQTTGIAPSDDLRTARFVGDRGFVMTTRRIDPLFTLDLSTAEEPRVVGELHVPGYAKLMHLVDADHLLTIGFDAEDRGGVEWFEGVHLQIFDVTDATNPTRAHMEIIETRGSTSDAAINHLTFDYLAPLDLMTIPMAICEEGPEGTHQDVMTFNGLLVYDVSLASGFQERGRIDHGEPPMGNDCSNWWMSSTSQVRRSLVIDDVVFSITADRVIAAGLDDLSTPLASIDLVH